MSVFKQGPSDSPDGGATSLNGIVSEPDMPDEYSGPMIDLRSIKDAAHRRRKLWLGTALAGLVIGAAFHLFIPAKYSAVTDLYMVEPAGSDPGQATENDVSLLETRTVATQAIANLHINADPASFVSTYQGIAPSPSILSIKLSAASPAEAIDYDNAVANAFLQVRTQQLSLQTGLVINGLQSLANSLNGDIKVLTNEINALSSGPAQQQSANKIAQLVSDRTNDASQIAQLQQQQQQDVVNEKDVAEGTRVLDPAVAVNTSDKKVIATDGLSGLVAGLAIGLGIVIVGAAISERPRRRADVAAALGVPVELSVGKYRPPALLRHRRLRRLISEPGTTLQMIMRHLARNLDSAPGCSLAVVPIGDVEPAAIGVASLALMLARQGQRVVLVDMAEGRPLSTLLVGRHRVGATAVPVYDQVLTVIVTSPDPGAIYEECPEDADVILVLASADPAFGAEHIASLATTAVVVVTAGDATATLMASSTHVLRIAGVSTTSAILIGADVEDDSVGVVGCELPPPELPAPSLNGAEDSFGVRKGGETGGVSGLHGHSRYQEGAEVALP